MIVSEIDRRQTAILTVDVEDNFFEWELVRAEDWGRYEKQVVENTGSVIALLKEIGAEATFFVAGKVAERHAEVVSMIVEADFELGSHGYAHKPLWGMTEREFAQDLENSLNCLTRISGTKVKGFRAPFFSIGKKNLWALDIVKRFGFEYDASMKDVEMPDEACLVIPEFPVSTKRFLGRDLALSGGVALRLMPFSPYLNTLERSASFNRCPLIYFHAWEFNKDQPKRNVGLFQSLFQSSFTFTTPGKVRRLANYFRFLSIGRYIGERCYEDRISDGARKI
ncbi:MAG: Peptidoglycan deacetylase [Syntrophorhabdaceae bacterium PtaU1.Bin034]|nr:MAG: Peptidoglycan deacetylase [Syntrophorhabdaceae bacterium PtaU1.Bin034]